MDRKFVYGVATGVVAVWAFHRFVKPIKSNKSA